MSDWEGKTRGGSFGYRFFIFLIKHAGVKPAYVFLSLVVVYFIPFAPKATAAAWYYFRHIHHFSFFKSVRMLFLNYYRLGQVLIDKIAINAGLDNSFSFKFEDEKEMRNLLDARKGMILIGAHVGAWEIGGQFFADYKDRINIVMVDAEYEKIKQILDDTLNEKSYKVIPVKENSFDHVYAIKDALDKNECVCFQGDRFVGDKNVLQGTLLGHPAKFPPGPFYLASLLNYPVAFYYSLRNPKKTYTFKFSFVTPATHEKRAVAIQGLLNQYTVSLDQVLEEYPEQWFNFYKFWD